MVGPSTQGVCVFPQREDGESVGKGSKVSAVDGPQFAWFSHWYRFFGVGNRSGGVWERPGKSKGWGMFYACHQRHWMFNCLIQQTKTTGGERNEADVDMQKKATGCLFSLVVYLSISGRWFSLGTGKTRSRENWELSLSDTYPSEVAELQEKSLELYTCL